MVGDGVFLHVTPNSCKDITLGCDLATAKVRVCVWVFVCVSDKRYVKQNNNICACGLADSVGRATLRDQTSSKAFSEQQNMASTLYFCHI